MTLSGKGLADPLVASTGDDGECPFKDVPPGVYTLAVEKAGYFAPEAPVSGVKGVISVEATVPPESNIGTIVLVKSRTITGVVRWDNEEPAERVIVHALTVKRGRALMIPGDVFLVTTNDRGEFRLENMRPGRYVAYAYVPGLAVAFTKPRTALPVFYPNSPVPDAGGSIDLRNTAEPAPLLMTFTKPAAAFRLKEQWQSPQSFPKGRGVYLGITIAGSLPPQAIAGVELRKPVSHFGSGACRPGLYRIVAVPKNPPVFLTCVTSSRFMSEQNR